MSQSRHLSRIETSTKVVIGAAVSWTFTMSFLPILGLKPKAIEAALITLAYMPISWLTNYALRRIFNRLGRRGWSSMSPARRFSLSMAQASPSTYRALRRRFFR